MRLLPSTLLAIPTAAIALTLLAGCVPTEVEPPATSSPTPSATADASATPTPTAAVEEGVPVDVDCSELVTPQELYDYNPNFALESAFTPSPGSLAAQAVAAKGIACSWVNLTSGETIVMTVAHLTESALTARGNDLIASSNSVPTYGVEGYFVIEGATGTAQALSSPYWVTATSKAFFEPGDVSPLMAAALSALG